MNLLAFDTSTEYLSLAIQKDEDVFTFDVNAGQTHSQIILPQIKALLNRAEITLADLQGIAFGVGPGSFTGVRIAAGVAQGLGYGANLPVVGVCTLQALAETSGAQKVIACLDARMGEVYFAAYEKMAEQWQEVIAPSLHNPDAVPVVEGDNWVSVGSGWQTYAEQLRDFYGAKLLAELPQLLPNASAILKLALPVFLAGNAKPAAEAQPIYIRNRVALKTTERKQGLRL
ncbi:MAG: tRNA (adenosine(37)-N6)-threonylcarbamoyltransferase complex dimerization subunit type 1 TsaB [Methylophilaceae bacterium]